MSEFAPTAVIPVQSDYDQSKVVVSVGNTTPVQEEMGLQQQGSTFTC